MYLWVSQSVYPWNFLWNFLCNITYIFRKTLLTQMIPTSTQMELRAHGGAFVLLLNNFPFLGRGRVAARGLYRRRVSHWVSDWVSDWLSPKFPQISTSFQSWISLGSDDRIGSIFFPWLRVCLLYVGVNMPRAPRARGHVHVPFYEGTCPKK